MAARPLSLVALLCACGAPAPAPWLSAGDTIVVDEDQGISDPFGAELFAVEQVRGDRVSAVLFGSTRSFPLAAVAKRAELVPGCPAGEIVLVAVTRSLWDISLALGSDGTRCYVQAPTGTERWPPETVYRLPARWEARFAGRRRDLALAHGTRAWAAGRPPGWRPAAGDEVRVWVGGRRSKTGYVRDARPAALRVGAEWVSDRQIAPIPDGSLRAAPGEIIHPLDEQLVFVVTSSDAAGAVVARGEDGPTRFAHDGYVVLRPPPRDTPARADVVGRTFLWRDLLVDLGAVEALRRGDLVVAIRADGTPVAEGRADLLPGDDLDDAFTRADAAGAQVVVRVDKELLALHDLRLLVPAALPPALRSH